MIKILIAFLIAITSILLAKEKLYLPNLCEIESGSNNYAPGKRSERGKIEELPKGALDAYNKDNNKRFTAEDSQDPAVNKAVAIWYKEKKVPEMLKARELPIDKTNVNIAYKTGIGNALPDTKHPEGSVSKYVNNLNKTKNEKAESGTDRYNAVKATSGKVKYPDAPKKKSGYVKTSGNRFYWRD